MAVTRNFPRQAGSSIDAEDIWDVDLSGYSTAGSGGKLMTDNLNAKVGDVETKVDTVDGNVDTINANTETNEATGTATYGDAGGEQNIIEQSLTTRRKIESIWLDLNALTKGGTWKLSHKIDGSNYRQFDSGVWGITDDDGVQIDGFTVNNDWKLTWTEADDEGGDRNIKYNIIYAERE